MKKRDREGRMAFSAYLHDGNALRAESLLQARGGEIVVGLSGRLWRLDPDGRRVLVETVSPWIGGARTLDE